MPFNPAPPTFIFPPLDAATAASIAERKKKERIRKRLWRKRRTSEQKEKGKAYDRNRYEEKVEKMTPQQRERHLSAKRKSTANWRKNLSKQKKCRIATQDCAQHRKRWRAGAEQRKKEKEEKKNKVADEDDKSWRETMNNAETYYSEHNPLFKGFEFYSQKNLERAEKREARNPNAAAIANKGREELLATLIDLSKIRNQKSNLLEDKRRGNMHHFQRRECTSHLPFDADYKLCNPVKSMGVTYSYQCRFCNDLFIQYPAEHMKRCSRKDPTTFKDRDPKTMQKNVDILEWDIEDYGTTVCDTSNDWEGETLPIDSNYALRRPVFCKGETYNFQCWFCNKLFKSFNKMFLFHMGACSESQYASAALMREFIDIQEYLHKPYDTSRRYGSSYTFRNH